MSDVHPQPVASPPEPRGPEPGGGLGRKLVIGAIVVGLLVVAYLFAVSILPRWWSHQVGDQVDGDLTTGGLLGFMYGFFATVLPLLVIGAVWRFRRRSVWAWLVGVPIALLLATPSLVTLGISLGDGGAAHAADRTLDVEAPWFRGGMVLGVAVGAGLAIYVVFSAASRSRAHRGAQAARASLEAERREREAQDVSASEPPA